MHFLFRKLKNRTLKEDLPVTSVTSFAGLTRHNNVKHNLAEFSEPANDSMPKTAAAQNNFGKKSMIKLAGDECYTNVIRNEFKCFTITSHKVNNVYQLVKNTVNDSHSDTEKFYPNFYKCISENEPDFISLSRHCLLLLGFEVANHILAHFGGSVIQEKLLTQK